MEEVCSAERVLFFVEHWVQTFLP